MILTPEAPMLYGGPRLDLVRAIVKAPGHEAAPGYLPASPAAMQSVWGTSEIWGQQLKSYAAAEIGDDLIFLSRETSELAGAENLRAPFELNGAVAIVKRSGDGGYADFPAELIYPTLVWALTHDAGVRAEGLSYHGISEGAGYDRVYVQRKPERQRPARRYVLTHHQRHSRVGFSWSFAGDGPLDLARCILADALGLPLADDGSARFLEVEHLYARYSADVIEKLPSDDRGWTIDGADVLRWLRENPPAAVCRRHQRVRDHDGSCEMCATSSPTVWAPPGDFLR